MTDGGSKRTTWVLYGRRGHYPIVSCKFSTIFCVDHPCGGAWVPESAGECAGGRFGFWAGRAPGADGPRAEGVGAGRGGVAMAAKIVDSYGGRHKGLPQTLTLDHVSPATRPLRLGGLRSWRRTRRRGRRTIAAKKRKTWVPSSPFFAVSFNSHRFIFLWFCFIDLKWFICKYVKQLKNLVMYLIHNRNMTEDHPVCGVKKQKHCTEKGNK